MVARLLSLSHACMSSILGGHHFSRWKEREEGGFLYSDQYSTSLGECLGDQCQERIELGEIHVLVVVRSGNK